MNRPGPDRPALTNLPAPRTKDHRSAGRVLLHVAAAALGLLWTAAALATDLQQALRQQLTALETGEPLVVADVPVPAGGLLPAIYARRDYAPAWTDSRRVAALRDAVQLADLHGLDSADYRLPAVAALAAALQDGAAVPRDEQARLDIALTDSFARLVAHLRHGKVDPLRVHADWNLGRGDAGENLAADVAGALESGDIRGLVDRAIPSYRPYQRLVKALADYRRLQQGPAWPTVSAGDTLRQGERSPRIREVRARLKATGELRADAPMTDVFDAELAEAVKRFQAHHALAADGAIGRKTLAAMNTSVASRVDQIRVNLERMRWAMHALRGTYVVVDIAGYDVTFVRDDQVIWESRAQVGQPLRMTPVLRSSFTNIVLNPNWTVPPTVLDKDIIPAARQDPEVVYKKGLRILDRDHNEFDPYEIDWERYSGKNFPYLLRQDPGDGNSLGRIKFNFPNKHAVYMHDTPKKSWFDRSERAFSSGCIRVDKPLELAELLLDDPKRWTQARVEEAIDRGSTRTLVLRKPVPVLILYWTVDVDEQGRVRFKQDIYNNDRFVLDELGKRSGNYGSIRAARDGRPAAGQATSDTTKEAHGV